jgi:hypothetical protein
MISSWRQTSTMCPNDALLGSMFFLLVHFRHLLLLKTRSFWRPARLKWLRRSWIVYNSTTPPTLFQIKLWQMFTTSKICKLVIILIVLNHEICSIYVKLTSELHLKDFRAIFINGRKNVTWNDHVWNNNRLKTSP